MLVPVAGSVSVLLVLVDSFAGVGVEPDRVGEWWGSWHTVGVLRDHTARYELWVTSVPPFSVSSVCWVGWGLVGVVFGC
jgi:hypothetical protein